ncbi:MAG: pseudaminic acid synthase [Candidatus Nealsonbacteria bacterium]|nr:pseudaminic acid synthase [Candidatus Nealsonbacteria bacterium]
MPNEQLSTLQIAGRRIGAGEPPWIVAEMSANHGGQLRRAARIVEAAAAAGADAVKLQTYTADEMTLDCDRSCFHIEGTVWAGRTLHALYREAAMPRPWHPELKRLAEKLGIVLFSTPFSPAAVDFLEELPVPAYKIASFELVDLPLLRRVAGTGKPVILSTGMATRAEIDEAVGTLRTAGCRQLALLKCTSAYPAAPEKMNLRAISHLRETFSVPVGLSDHSLDGAVPVAAVACGACIIEKHLTLSRADGGPDAAFSLQPEEFAKMVRAVHAAHAALGSVRYGADDEEAAAVRLRRSLFVVEDVAAGEPFTAENVRCIRPGDGLHPRELEAVLGRTAREDVSRGTPLQRQHVNDEARMTNDE